MLASGTANALVLEKLANGGRSKSLTKRKAIYVALAVAFVVISLWAVFGEQSQLVIVRGPRSNASGVISTKERLQTYGSFTPPRRRPALALAPSHSHALLRFARSPGVSMGSLRKSSAFGCSTCATSVPCAKCMQRRTRRWRARSAMGCPRSCTSRGRRLK